MKKQKLFSALNNSFTVRRSIIFLFAVFFGIAQTASAQQPSKVTVEIGKSKCNKLKKPVNPNVQKTVNRPTFAKASFNPATEIFCVEGLSEGKTRVTFTGTYRQANNNNNNNNGGMVGGIQQNAVRFRFDWDVTVVPLRVETVDANVFPVQVERGKNRDIRIEAVLGQEFANTADNGVKWRNVNLTDDDKGIVSGDLFDNNQLKVRLTGVNNGKTKLTLQGELRKNNVWEIVKRTLEVTVIANNAENADPWLEGMKRRLAELKNTAKQAGEDERNLNRSIRDFEGFGTLLNAEILKESNSETPRPLRKAQLENLRDEASNELQNLRNRFNEIAKQIRPIGWRDDVRAVNIVLGTLPAQRTFFCPANPNKGYGTIYGTDQYLINSSLCGAAVHAGAITFAGGNITVEFHRGIKGDKYLGSKRNGVTTESWERDWGWFVFVR